MSHPTKHYSFKQEHMIANYLGWKVVTGSGARAFHPGDIRSDDFLGECKTHTKKTDKIIIYKNVWKKIVSEATSVMKTPILFVDNGTQSIKNTWCILPTTLSQSDNATTIVTDNIHIASTQFSFSNEKIKNVIHDAKIINETDTIFVCIQICVDGDLVYLCALPDFKTALSGG